MSPPHSLFFHKRAICDTFTSTTRNFPSIVFHLEYLRAAGRVESNYQKESKMSCLCSQQSHARLGVKDNVMSAEHIPIHQRGCPATWWNHLQERTSTVHFRGHWRTPWFLLSFHWACSYLGARFGAECFESPLIRTVILCGRYYLPHKRKRKVRD